MFNAINIQCNQYSIQLMFDAQYLISLVFKEAQNTTKVVEVVTS